MKKNPYKFFTKNGYCVIDLLNNNSMQELIDTIVKKINSEIKKKECKFTNKNVSNFHLKKLDEKIIKNIFNSSKRYINLKENIIRKINTATINSFLSNLWNHNQKKIVWVGSPKLKEIKFNKAGYRIFIPTKGKGEQIKKRVGFPHIDAYSESENNFVTLWIPLFGFSEKYTMMIAPQSHKINHSPEKFDLKKNYISRIFSSNYIKKFDFVRPRLNRGQAIIHHPNVIHSGGSNLGSKTRISVEIRLFDKTKFHIKKNFDLKLYN